MIRYGSGPSRGSKSKFVFAMTSNMLKLTSASMPFNLTVRDMSKVVLQVMAHVNRGCELVSLTTAVVDKTL